MTPSTTIRRQRRWLSRTAYYGSRFCFHREQPRLLSSTLADDPDLRFRWANQSRRLGGVCVSDISYQMPKVIEPSNFHRAHRFDSGIAHNRQFLTPNLVASNGVAPFFYGYEPYVTLVHLLAINLVGGLGLGPRILPYQSSLITSFNIRQWCDCPESDWGLNLGKVARYHYATIA